MKESDLIKRVQNGEKSATDALITSYYQPVFAYFYKNTGQYHQSMDLAQEVFIKMVSGITGYKPRASFKSWLFAIASNHLKNYFRTCSRRPGAAELTEDIPSARLEIPRIEIRHDVNEALTHLPPEQREAVILRFYYGFSTREIAQMTGAKEAAVKSRIRYGLDKLKKELEGYEP